MPRLRVQQPVVFFTAQRSLPARRRQCDGGTGANQPAPPVRELLVRDRCGRHIKLSKADGELLVIASGFVLKNAQGDGFAQLQELVGIAAVVDARLDAITESDVVPEFVEFSVYREGRIQVCLQGS